MIGGKREGAEWGCKGEEIFKKELFPPGNVDRKKSSALMAPEGKTA